MQMLTRADLLQEKSIPTWLKKQYAQWNEIVTSKAFPCHFGTQAEKQGLLRYCYVEKDYTHLPDMLCEFLRLSRTYPDKRHALVLFIKPEKTERSFEFYKKRFWGILNDLHRQDSVEWPDEFPKDPENRNWEFVFNGEQMFVSCNMPAYQNRTTRNLGDSQILIFQPRRLFQKLSYDTASGKKAIDTIRKRVGEIEKMPIHPDLGPFGTETLEWKQYVISDDEQEETGLCPFQFQQACPAGDTQQE